MSNPDIPAPLPSVTVVCVSPFILVISLLLSSFIDNNISGVFSSCVYVNELFSIFK